MTKRMLIDASHPEETRVVVLDGNRVEEFDFESATKRPLKGNIYLAKVTRVEPSLQAAFVEYGGNRQGFLAFSEIHPDYYQIPVADRMAILEAQTARMMAEEDVESIDTADADGSNAGETESQEDEEDDDEEDDSTSDNFPTDDPTYKAEVMEPPAPEVPDDQETAFADTGGQSPADTSILPENPATDENPVVEETHAAEPSEPASLAPEQPHDQPADEPAMDHPPEEDHGGAQQEESASAQVQAEATGAPVAWQRREPNRRHDRPRSRRRQYKIQEVIKRRQVMLVQVVKEERGNKGASLTTFLSLAGRYCVLMPNTPRGGGISRKITNAADRTRLKSAAQSLDLPEGMGLIIRTAGANRTKTEIKRDYEYLLRLWDTVRELTLQSNAPALVYEEGSLIKRAIRDLYSKEITEVLVDGEAGYRDAKEFMRMLMPSHAKNVKPYKEPLPLFQKLQVESQLDAMFSPVVNLKSGGYVVINQTEALVAIDVNSGRATREHSIEDTAYKTNLEAADEIARQLRLRDLAGLIVIDFIDMEDSKNDRNVEKRLHNAVRNDRARIQIGRISQFGLLELSRQRLRAGVVAGSTITCPHCNGQGIIRSTESAALRLLRALDEEGQHQPSVNLTVKTPLEVAIYTLNQKRRELARIEAAYDVQIMFDPQPEMVSGAFEIQRTGVRIPAPRPKLPAISVEAGFQEAEPAEPQPDVDMAEPPEAAAAEAEAATDPDAAGGDGRGRKRRRRRRGGRGRNMRLGPNGELEAQPNDAGANPNSEAPQVVIAELEYGETAISEFDLEQPETERGAAGEQPQQQNGENWERRRRRRRRGRRGRRFESDLHQGGDGQHLGDHHVMEQTVESATVAPLSGDLPEYVPPVFEQTSEAIVAPNMPSTPVWSLLDQVPPPPAAEMPPVIAEAFAPVVISGESTAQPESARQPADPAPVIAEAIAPVVISEPEPAPAETPASASTAVPQMELPEPGLEINEAPREARKGWWQRRFKA